MSGRRSVLGGSNPMSTLNSSRLNIVSHQSSHIITRTKNTLVESFGLSIPVLVNEALTFTDQNTSVSISFSTNGWAWAVYGRRLLVWPYLEALEESRNVAIESIRNTPQHRVPLASYQCRELTLPHSDIRHKASLITVFQHKGQQMASCLAVSPTGDVRYWPSIAHDGSSIDENGILGRQEFDVLENIGSHSYVLVTTTCNMVYLQIQVCGGRHTIFHRPLKDNSGLLGGFGKKLASIIIGFHSQERECKFIKVCSEQSNKDEGCSISLLADKWIQRWQITSNGSEALIFEDHDIYRKIKDIFHQQLWSHWDPNEVETRILDMQSSDSNIVFLVAGTNVSHTPSVHYALITFSNDGELFHFINFFRIKYNGFISSTNDVYNDSFRQKLILNQGLAYMYSDRKVVQTCHMVPVGQEAPIDVIEFSGHCDQIMAGKVRGRIPLFFSRLHGFVTLTPDTDNFELINQSFMSPEISTSTVADVSISQPGYVSTAVTNLVMYDLNPDEMESDDAISQMKAAFIYHLKKNTTRCKSILKDLFFQDDTAHIAGSDNKLDCVVISIAKDLAEDIPAADPRWEEMKTNNAHALGSSSSMQIIQQLKEKNMAYNHFVDFLHATGLWSKLDTASDYGNVKSTIHILADINEKIISAISLKKIHNNYSLLIDNAIETTLKERNVHITGNLTSQDLFYVQVTHIHRIFKVLANVSEEYIQAEQGGSKVASMLIDINTIVLTKLDLLELVALNLPRKLQTNLLDCQTVLNDIIKFRETKCDMYKLPEANRHKFEYLPWTAASGKNGLRDTLHYLISVTVKHGIRSTGEPEIRQRLYKQLVDLIDFVLDGRKSYLESVKDSERYGILLQQYESQRHDLIQTLVVNDQYELAAKLAEKYFDFQTLVVICDRTENQARLDEYIERYKDMNFSQFAINWHLRQNKRGDLFERFKGNQSDLTKFLSDHPSLAWVQAVFNGDMGKASRILVQLTESEAELVARKKTILSLAKLAALATTDGTEAVIENINNELSLIEYQEQIPEYLLQIFGYDTINPKVLKAEEIVNLFIAEEHEAANEYDFRKALELLPRVEDALDVRHKIWCNAILRDDWSHYNINTPQDDLQNKLFFKLVELCFLINTELDDFLPAIEDFLEAPELESIRSNKSFQYLMKLGYEHIFETFNKE